MKIKHFIIMAEIKPFYTLEDFENQKVQGKNIVAECPMCGKRHLSIGKSSGLFNCFTPGCGFRGQLYEFWPKERKERPAFTGGYKAEVLHTRKTESSATDVLPSDYHQLPENVVKQLKPLQDDALVVEYLQKQGIPLEVAGQASCCSALRTIESEQHHCLCYVTRVNGQMVNVKYRSVQRKAFSQDGQEDKELPSVPFNIDCINPLSFSDSQDCCTLVITEGEKDCLTLLAAGFQTVISVPNGASCKPEEFMKPFMQWLDGVQRIIVCGDEDRAGRTLKESVRKFFGSLNKPVAVCRMSMGCKDISEVNQRYGLDEVRRVVFSAEFPQNPDIIRINQIRQRVKDYMNDRYDHGYSVGYGPCTDEHLWLTDEGGLIIVTGRPNSGKTDWLRSTLVHLMVTGRACCFLSFEEPKKEKHIGRIVEVLMGTRQLRCFSEEQQDRILDWLEPRMTDLDMRQQAPTTRNIIRYADELLRDGFDMRFLVIDPYLFVDMGSSKENETKLIKDMLTTLQTWGRNRNIWVVMVAHPRMLNSSAGEFEEIDPYKVSGSAHWANLADFLLSVRRIFPNGENNDEGSLNPSYTRVSVLKVRDQGLCNTGNIYYMRHSSGRYFERDSEQACIDEIALYGGIKPENMDRKTMISYETGKA